MPIFQYQDFFNKANEVLWAPNVEKNAIGVVIIDFERFSELDGMLGYLAVDRIAEQVVKRLESSLRETDLIGHMGRHQFACLLSFLSTPSHAELAGNKILRILSEPFVQNGRRFNILPRVGIAIAGPAVLSVDELLRKANSAVCQARTEREPLKIYSMAIEGHMHFELDLLALDVAIEESRVFLVYQPQVDLSTGNVAGAEALLRWTHPQRGPIRPDVMVEVAERTALISKLTFWVFNTALRQCAEYRHAGVDIGISINFSAYNLREPDLVEIVTQGLDLWNVPPEKIVIELTETAIMDGHTSSMQALHAFKDMGLRIAMDDFGTGYSSMSLLRKLPIDELKIDMSFICNMVCNPDHERIVDSMISLAHKLGMRVIAEGVEDKETYEHLRKLGCDLIQGYLIGKPMPLEEFIPTVLAYNQSKGKGKRR